jgi:hypothetical protein
MPIDPKALADEIEQCWGYSIKIPTRIPKEAMQTIVAALRHECPKTVRDLRAEVERRMSDSRTEVALRLLEMMEHYEEEYPTERASYLLREAQKGSGE